MCDVCSPQRLRRYNDVFAPLEKLSAKQMPIAIGKDCNYFNDHMAPK